MVGGAAEYIAAVRAVMLMAALCSRTAVAQAVVPAGTSWRYTTHRTPHTRRQTPHGPLMNFWKKTYSSPPLFFLRSVSPLLLLSPLTFLALSDFFLLGFFLAKRVCVGGPVMQNCEKASKRAHANVDSQTCDGALLPEELCFFVRPLILLACPHRM